MKAIRTSNYDIRSYGDVTVRGLIEHSPIWGYKEGDRGDKLQFARYSLNSTEQEILDRFDSIIVHAEYYSINILNTYEDSILYIDENTDNLYGITSVANPTDVWVIQPSAKSLKEGFLTKNSGLVDQWGTDIVWIIEHIKTAKDKEPMNPKQVAIKYINIL